ncbi:MAG: outer membrane lipoprotein carrier protein LolA [Acidobacteriaceae bacterium]|nr:outer membrane lipoprotein carrier protein LolA [Acidobacteriaceae bacterium]
MSKSFQFGLLLFGIATVAWSNPAQNLISAATPPTQASPEQSKSNGDELQHVITQMDRTAANFRTTQANFVWTQYTAVVNDITDTQKGTVYFRRAGSQVEMMADINDPPPPKFVLFSGSKLQVFQPKIDQVTQYDTGKDRAAFESFLVLGFGGSGQGMLKSFDVKYLGGENVGGVETAKLELTPKSEKARNTFNRIWLWIDPTRGVSIQQKLFAPDGDYRLAQYSDIRLNQKIADNEFKLKTNGKTKFLSPKG